MSHSFTLKYQLDFNHQNMTSFKIHCLKMNHLILDHRCFPWLFIFWVKYSLFWAVSYNFGDYFSNITEFHTASPHSSNYFVDVDPRKTN